MNKPIRTVSLFCMALFLALMINATYLQFWRADDFNDRADNRRVIEAAYSSERGAILVGRTPIAESEAVDDEYEFLRTYPQPLMYAPVTGFFTIGNATGIERSQNEVLSGDDPRLFVRRLVDLLSNEPKRGGNVELTIDPAAQKAAYDGLTALGPDTQGAVVAIEPRTGKILAMVSLPTYDPNRLSSHDFGQVQRTYNRLESSESQPLLNRAIQTRLFPGSVFKVVTATAAVESGKYNSSDDLVPGGATYQLPQSTSTVSNGGRACGTDEIPFTQAMAQSCNTTFAALANEVGADAMLAQAEAFGFNSDYLEDLGPQARSNYPTDANEPNTALSGFGQYEVQSTPLQMAMVMAAIGNEGVVMRPYLVNEVSSADYDGEQIDPEELSTAMSPDSAEVLNDLLVATVEDGTGSQAAIPGVRVGGKTGTAQTGSEANPFAWFVSVAPAGPDAEVAVAVMIQDVDSDPSEIAGGALAGPIAKAVMEAVLQ